MFVVHRRDAPKDGSTPFLLYGYGGFGVNLEPSFSARLYPWLEAGGGYAVANLRGGGEYGEDWHKAGMLGNKQNVFDDFIAAGEYLVREGWTKPERLAIQGGSNGGLLVGAALTQRPDLFRAVICEVPLLDMVRYHRFGSGRTWVSEYGSADRQGRLRLALRLLAVPPREGGHRLPGGADGVGRLRRPRRPAPRPQDDGGPAGGQHRAGPSCCGSRRTPATAAPTWSAVPWPKAVDAYAFLFDQLGMRRRPR